MKLLYTLAFVAPFLFPAQGEKAINTPGPMNQPKFISCEQFKQAVTGDSCYSMAMANSITMDEFLRLNPALKVKKKNDCDSKKMMAGYWYCVKALNSGKGKKNAPHGKPTKTQKPKPKPKPTKTEKPKPPKTTKKPTTTSLVNPWTKTLCDWGSCWQAWMAVSTGEENYVFTSATNSCKRMSKMPKCTDVKERDLPWQIKEGCDTCHKLTSGCSCITNSEYNTYTMGYTYGSPDWDGEWLDPNMRKRAVATQTVDEATITPKATITSEAAPTSEVDKDEVWRRRLAK
ncbi:hypothetical protein ACO1O0_006867 [Amphichorda felina]